MFLKKFPFHFHVLFMFTYLIIFDITVFTSIRFCSDCSMWADRGSPKHFGLFRKLFNFIMITFLNRVRKTKLTRKIYSEPSMYSDINTTEYLETSNQIS